MDVTCQRYQTLFIIRIVSHKPSGLDSCWLVIGYFEEFHGEGVKHTSGAAAVEKGQQPRHLPRGVHRSRVARQQSVTHVVHHGGQVCRRLLGHSVQDTGEGGDVRVAVILSDVRGNCCEELVSVASDVIAVPENI